MRWLPWVLLALAALALIASAVPWMSCDLCGGVRNAADELYAPHVVACLFCQDRPISPVRRYTARRPHPRLARLGAPPAPAAALACRSLLEACGVNPPVTDGRTPPVWAMFIDTEGGWRCALIRGPYESSVHPGSAIQLYIFDEEARLLDQAEFRSRDPARFPAVVPERRAVLKVGLVALGRDPASGGLEVIVGGRSAEYPDSGARIDLSSGRMAVAP